MTYGNKPGRGGGYRGSGRGSGRTNGRGNGRSNRNNNRDNKEQKDELKFCPFQEGRKQVTYDTVVEHIYGLIRKNYKYGNDCVMYLRTGDMGQCGEKPKRDIAKYVDA